MRKLGKENWKLFVLLSILTVIIIIALQTYAMPEMKLINFIKEEV